MFLPILKVRATAKAAFIDLDVLMFTYLYETVSLNAQIWRLNSSWAEFCQAHRSVLVIRDII